MGIPGYFNRNVNFKPAKQALLILSNLIDHNLIARELLPAEDSHTTSGETARPPRANPTAPRPRRPRNTKSAAPSGMGRGSYTCFTVYVDVVPTSPRQ